MITGAYVAKDVFAVTPSDTVVFSTPVVIECLGTAGNIVVDTLKGSKVTYPIASNTKLTCLVTKVWSTNTTATTLWAYEM